MRGPKKLGWLAGGDAAGVAGCVRWWGLSSPQWGQRARRCAAPRQTQWLGLQGRAVCGSRWRTQRGHAVAGGWRYLWTDGGVRACGLALCACGRACVWCLWCLCMSRRCCVRWMVRGLGGRSLEGALRLVEQEFEELGLVCRG